jgi:hypothetical protein
MTREYYYEERTWKTERATGYNKKRAICQTPFPNPLPKPRGRPSRPNHLRITRRRYFNGPIRVEPRPQNGALRRLTRRSTTPRVPDRGRNLPVLLIFLVARLAAGVEYHSDQHKPQDRAETPAYCGLG